VQPGFVVVPAPGKMPVETRYRTIDVGGLKIFYREAGPAAAPVVLLLHGFPTSSRVFRNLIPMLSDKYRVIAPDYPAFGHSAVPSRSDFHYTHAHLSDVVEALIEKLGLAWACWRALRWFMLAHAGGVATGAFVACLFVGLIIDRASPC
jgi:pimeloyl-ACP methyl ester carboxylesterase